MTLYNPIHMISMADLVGISEETPRTDSRYTFKKEFTELIHKNPEW